MTDQERNRAVATKLGWSYDPKFQDWADPEDVIRPLPDYVHDMTAVWVIVQNQVVKGLGFALLWSEHTKEWECAMSPRANENDIIATAASAPSAICEAFLKTP